MPHPIRLSLLLLAGACGGAASDSAGGSDSAAAEAPAEGRLAVSLAIIDDIADIMDEPPSGVFYGGIFLEDDVTPTGTVDGAVALETFQVEVALDPAGARTDVVYETGDLPTELVYIIGFLDSDASVAAGAEVDAEQGDPVTLPGFDDRYEVVGGEASAAEITLDLLFP